MAEERALPIPAEHREFTVKVGGEPVARAHQLLSVSVSLVCNRIGRARLAYLDGSAASSTFPLSEADVFKPGQSVEILAGAGGQTDSLFKGIVVRHSLRVRDHSAPQLIVDCRHVAFRLTIARRSAHYVEQSDSNIIENLLGAAGITGDIESTTVTHPQLVQFNATDWDFLLARARANSKLVWPRDDQLVMKAPSESGSANVTLQFGATLLELDAEIDTRHQFASLQGIAWDPAQQDILQVDAETPSFEGPGNLSPDDLAEVAGAEPVLRHAALSEAAAQAWADSHWLHARLNKVSGRAKCEGIGSIKPGDIVALSGVGARFNGNVFITGVRHEFDLVQGWKTHVQFGGVDDEAPAYETLSTPPAGNLLTRVTGLQIGMVTSNEDPDGEHRVRIRLPLVDQDDDGVWARAASPDAGDDRGFFFRPEIGDEVVVGFLEEDPTYPVILGMLHSSAKAAPLAGSDDNHEKLYKSRSGMRVYFNDDTKVLTLDTPAGNSLTLSEDEKAIVLADQNGNKIQMNADGITLESAKAIVIKAATEATLESGTAFSVKGGSELKLEGSASAELSSAANTKITGGMVQIN